MARNDPQVNFRLPADLHDRLKSSAAENNRSVSAELVSRLEASFEDPGIQMPIFQDLLTRLSDSAIAELLTAAKTALRESKERLVDLEDEFRSRRDLEGPHATKSKRTTARAK